MNRWFVSKQSHPRSHRYCNQIRWYSHCFMNRKIFSSMISLYSYHPPSPYPQPFQILFIIKTDTSMWCLRYTQHAPATTLIEDCLEYQARLSKSYYCLKAMVSKHKANKFYENKKHARLFASKMTLITINLTLIIRVANDWKMIIF